MSPTERIDKMSKEIHETIDKNNQIISGALDNLDKMIAENKLLKTHLSNSLETWEAKWDFDKQAGYVSEYSYEELGEYVAAARFMEKLGRNNNRANEVFDHMTNLTIC